MDFEIGNNDSDNMDSTGESRYFGNDAVGFFFRNSLKHHTDLTNANVRSHQLCLPNRNRDLNHDKTRMHI